MIALNFDCSISHPVDGLVDNYSGMRLSHDFVDLVALGADEEGDHALRDKNDNGKWLPLDFFEDLVDIREEQPAALVFLLHLFVINLSYKYFVLKYFCHLNLVYLSPN